MKKYIGILIILTAIACKKETKPMDEQLKAGSSDSSKERTSVASKTSQLKQVLGDKGFTVMATIDHAAAAKKVGLELRPTQTLIFGNPKGGTLLMQQSQEIGIDLPLKVVIWEDQDGSVQTTYRNATALSINYGITEPKLLIDKVDGLFAKVVGNTTISGGQDEKNASEKLIIKKSPLSTQNTFNRLKQVVTSRGLQIMLDVPHDKAAAGVNLSLRPTQLLVFGNPKVGTLLMQSNQEIGLDLPLKILVHENEKGETLISYYDASFYASRYGIQDKDEVVQKINNALESITNEISTKN